MAALTQAQKLGLKPGRSIYLGLDGSDCTEALAAGFTRALSIPFQGRDLLDAVESSGRAALTVLLVDDSDLIHRHTRPILQAEGYEVVEAWDGEQALALCAERRFDLILTDVEMPKLDGWELCRRIKQDPKTEHIPVVICSSLGEASDLEKGFDLGADEYLVKPVVAEELVGRLQALLATKMLSQRERLLVVDDSAAIRHLVSDCLKRQGFSVTTAVDGQDGLEKAIETKPELILTDYDMPRMTGFELVVALRRDERTRDIPLVMLTARDTKRDQAQMRAAGLEQLLGQAVRHRQVHRARRARARGKAPGPLQGSVTALHQRRRRASGGGALARSGSLSDVRAKEVDATLLFSDISGFTNMSSKMKPAEVVAILNESFDALCVRIRDFGGDIDKFIGDAIMAVFEDRPEFEEPHTLRAARAAWAMQESLAAYNARRKDEPPLVMRIGLNSGTVVRGDIGSRFVRRDYTCIGRRRKSRPTPRIQSPPRRRPAQRRSLRPHQSPRHRRRNDRHHPQRHRPPRQRLHPQRLRAKRGMTFRVGRVSSKAPPPSWAARQAYQPVATAPRSHALRIRSTTHARHAPSVRRHTAPPHRVRCDTRHAAPRRHTACRHTAYAATPGRLPRRHTAERYWSILTNIW